MAEEWGLPPEVENTAQSQKRQAEARVAQAHTGDIATDEVVSRMQKALSEIREMHRENHYREILLPILQGSHRRA